MLQYFIRNKGCYMEERGKKSKEIFMQYPAHKSTSLLFHAMEAFLYNEFPFLQILRASSCPRLFSLRILCLNHFLEAQNTSDTPLHHQPKKYPSRKSRRIFALIIKWPSKTNGTLLLLFLLLCIIGSTAVKLVIDVFRTLRMEIAGPHFTVLDILDKPQQGRS